MPSFHNPYHFVPIPKPTPQPPIPGAAPRNRGSWPPHLTHDRFVTKTIVDGSAEKVFSGRIVCRLSVEEYLAIGGKQTKGTEEPLRPRIVELFTIHGKPAIPASSLRGMLSALAEAASNSTLRVLENAPLRVREWNPQSHAMADVHPVSSVRDWFRKAGNHMVPLQQGDDRQTLTLAEQLFGFIEEPPTRSTPLNNNATLTLAGRLRPSNALLLGNSPETQTAVTKILASPKPPSPALYLTALSPDGGFISKRSAHQQKARIQGRKFYLHRERLTPADWHTAANNLPAEPDETLHQKAQVSPLGPCVFWFHIDFNNLSKLEIELLCYVLRPAINFRHKLGMGKPLGLGKVEIDPMGLFLVDRLARYRDDPLNCGNRYHQIWRSEISGQWPAEYKREFTEIPTDPSAPSPLSLRDDYRNRIKTFYPTLFDALLALELIGNPNAVRFPVHYPQIANVAGADMETEQFKWWVENEQMAGQFLRPLTPANTANFEVLPALEREASQSPPSPPSPRQAPPPTAPAQADWIGPVECVFEKKEIGATPRLIFRVANRTGGQTPRGYLASNADVSRLPQPLQQFARIQLRYTTIDGKVVFDFPPA